MARSTLSELSNLWEQRDVSDEEYVAALRERIEELEKRVEALEWVEGAHASCGDWPRERTLRAEKRVGELERENESRGKALDMYEREVKGYKKRAEAAEAKLAAWKRAESLPDCLACAALEAEGE